MLFLIIATLFLRFYHIENGELIGDEKRALKIHDAMISSAQNFLIIPMYDKWITEPVLLERTRIHLNYGVLSIATPLAWYIKSFLMFFSGANKFGVRFSTAIFGALYVILFYLFSRRIYNKKISMLSSLLLAFFPFSIVNARNGAIFEPITLSFFIGSLFFLPSLKNSTYGRLIWGVISALMLFSNFYKAIILLSILFIWEFILIFHKNKKIVRETVKLGFYYALLFIPSIAWAFLRAYSLDIPLFWLFQFPFVRGATSSFRIIEIFWSYGAIKQAATLLIPALIGLFLFLSYLKKKNFQLKEPTTKINLLWALMMLIIPLQLFFARQGGAYNHSLIAIPIVVFTVYALHSAHSSLKKNNINLALFLIFTSWIFVILSYNMGSLINEVPKTDILAFPLYKETFFSILKIPTFIIPLILVTTFSFFMLLARKNKYLCARIKKTILPYTLITSILSFIFYATFIVIFNKI